MNDWIDQFIRTDRVDQPDALRQTLRQMVGADRPTAGEGIYDGEPLWVPFYHGLAVQGYADFAASNEDGEKFWQFEVGQADWSLFPELAGANRIDLVQRPEGWVMGFRMPSPSGGDCLDEPTSGSAATRR